MIVSDDALVLHSRKFGDSSRIITSYSKDHGKISLMAKGAYKPKSKFGVSVEPLNLSHISFYKKANRELHLLSASEILVNLHKIHSDLDKMAYGFMISEAIEQTQIQESANPELYELLKTAFILLNEENNSFSIFVHTILSLTKIMGFAIELPDYKESTEDDTDYFFSFGNGRVSREKPEYGRYFYLSSGALDIITKLLEMTAQQAASFESNINKQKLINFFIEYLGFHLEKRFYFKSQKLLMV